MAQWLRICLPMQGHGFGPWVGSEADRPQLLSLHALESVLPN